MQFCILGPLQVLEGSRRVDLPRRKHRALLAVLVLRAGEVVSADRLIEELWGETPPRTAKDALQNYVSLLRKTLGGDVLVTRDSGYVLDVRPEQIDATRFESLLAGARTASGVDVRAEKLREALGLWRGPPLADLAYEPFAAIEIARLEELRLAASEDLIDAELELGRHSDLVPELEALIQEHPYDERLRGQLMLALYRAGRQAEALEAYQSARHVLVDELGLEPGPPLRELEQAILRHDPALGASRPVPAPASRRTVTALFAGIAVVANRDPEMIAAWLERFRGTVERHGGRAAFLGDSAMAVFGAPVAHEDDALRAVRTAVELRETQPGLRIGVATGEVYAGGELLTGEAVTAAKQLEQSGSDGDLLVAASTLRLVRDAVHSRRAKRGGRVAFRIDELIEGAPGIARRLDAPLVDRELELTALRQAFETAREERRCVVFTSLGEAGIGKTRLARELAVQVRDEATVLVGRCVSYGEGATFLPLREMIGEDFDAIVDAAGSTGEVFLAARRRFEELATDRPLLLVFEDVHWAEPTLLDLIEYLGAQASGAPILALCLSRPDLLAERAGWAEIGPSLALAPLPDELARELVGDEPHADRIVEIADGNPLYVEQLRAYVEEEGVEALDTVPGSIEALLASRLDRIGPAERAVAQRAAVVGRRFAPAAVAALGAVEALPALESAGFVHRAGTLYRFDHVLVRDVVYAGTPKAERAELHRCHAEWLEGQPDGSDELIGYHLERAALYLGELGAPAQQVEPLAESAGRRLGAAGIRAWKRGDAATAVSLLGRATALLPENDACRLELVCELGEALRTSGAFARAQAVLTAVRIEAGAVGERRLELRAELALLSVQLSVDPEARADELLDRAVAAIPILEELGDDRALGRAWFFVAHIKGPYHLHYAEAEEAASNALGHYERAGWPFAACLATLASALVNGPAPVVQAIQTCEHLLDGADLNGEANLLPFLGALRAMSGDFEQARECVRRSQEIFVELGQALAAEYSCGSEQSEIEVLAGDLAAAQEALDSSYAILERHGERSYLATRAAALADVLYRRGRYRAAARRVREAQSGSTSDDVTTQWQWRAVGAKLAARDGDVERAETLACEAVEFLAGTDALNIRAACLLDLAEVLTLAKRSAEGAAAIQEAVKLYEKKGNVVAAARARSLVIETTESS
jgi:DNA-binding SARP family transcriptional activator/predicted ATPase